jgi:hypothetical protein
MDGVDPPPRRGALQSASSCAGGGSRGAAAAVETGPSYCGSGGGSLVRSVRYPLTLHDPSVIAGALSCSLMK